MFDLRSLEHSTIIYETPGRYGPGGRVYESKSQPTSARPDSNGSSNSMVGAEAAPLKLDASGQVAEEYATTPVTCGVNNGLASLVRLAFNRLDPNYLATFCVDSNDVQILDVRVPGLPVAELRGHTNSVNCMAWAPHSNGHICTGGEDSQVLVWDLHQPPRPKNTRHPILSYTAQCELTSLAWSPILTEWIAVGFGNVIQALRI